MYLKIATVLLSSLFAFGNVMASEGARIKELSAEISNRAETFEGYSNLTRQEKRQLRFYLKDVIELMNDLGIYEPVKRVSQYYCEGRALYDLESGTHKTYLTNSEVCEKVVQYDIDGISVYCDGRALHKMHTFKLDRYLSNASVCEKVIISITNGNRFYCDGRALYKTDSGTLDRYLTDPQTCEKVAKSLNQ